MWCRPGRAWWERPRPPGQQGPPATTPHRAHSVWIFLKPNTYDDGGRLLCLRCPDTQAQAGAGHHAPQASRAHTTHTTGVHTHTTHPAAPAVPITDALLPHHTFLLLLLLLLPRAAPAARLHYSPDTIQGRTTIIIIIIITITIILIMIIII